MQKLEKSHEKSAKNLTFDPHAAKAQNKKIWYLKGQRRAATVSPADHQTEPQKVAITRENPFPDHAKNHQIIQTDQNRKKDMAVMLHLAMTEDHLHHQTGSHTVADLTVRTKAVFQADRHLIKKASYQKAGPIPADHLVMKKAVLVVAMATRKAFHQKANHTLAGQQAMTDRQEVLAVAKDQVKKEVLRLNLSRIQAGHQMMSAHQKALATIRQVKDPTQKTNSVQTGHLRTGPVQINLVINHQATDHIQKINLVLISQKEISIANHHATALKKAMPILLKISLIPAVRNPLTIKLLLTATRRLKRCAAKNQPNQKTTALSGLTVI